LRPGLRILHVELTSRQFIALICDYGVVIADVVLFLVHIEAAVVR
jgi:hypothetical protein